MFTSETLIELFLRSIQRVDTMDKIDLDFRMARSERNDQILRAICKEALSCFFEHIDSKRIQCVLLTGSVANGEGTVIGRMPSIIASDFDFVSYSDLQYYIKNRAYFGKLSRRISLRLQEKGIRTHVEFLPTPSILHATTHFAMPKIYEYEFAFASKCVFGEFPPFKKVVCPSKKDALDLVFTVVSDLVFSEFKGISETEKSYIYAKRALTLLNSILIFHGFYGETYEKRMELARKYMRRAVFPISDNEMRILEGFNEYKLDGILEHLLESIMCAERKNAIRFQKDFLEKLTIKILHYELENYFRKTAPRPKGDVPFSEMTQRLPVLLEEYSRRSRGRLVARIGGIILFLYAFVSRDRERKELFATFIFHRQPPKVIMNVLTTLLFIYKHNISAARILRETFPWIDFDNANSVHKMFMLWQSAAQSIKLS